MDEFTAFNQFCEDNYRKGYDHGVRNVVTAARAGFTHQNLIAYQRAVTNWRKGDGDQRISPPLFSTVFNREPPTGAMTTTTATATPIAPSTPFRVEIGGMLNSQLTQIESIITNEMLPALKLIAGDRKHFVAHGEGNVAAAAHTALQTQLQVIRKLADKLAGCDDEPSAADTNAGELCPNLDRY